MRAAYGRRSRAHFDAKGEGNKLFADAGVPTTYLNTTFFYQGFLNGMTPKRADDGVLSLSLPFEEGKLLAGVDVNDIGRTAYAILEDGEPHTSAAPSGSPATASPAASTPASSGRSSASRYGSRPCRTTCSAHWTSRPATRSPT